MKLWLKYITKTVTQRLGLKAEDSTNELKDRSTENIQTVPERKRMKQQQQQQTHNQAKRHEKQAQGVNISVDRITGEDRKWGSSNTGDTRRTQVWAVKAHLHMSFLFLMIFITLSFP